MSEEFYVNRNTDHQGNHEVHRKKCYALPEAANRKFLGIFATSHAAVAEAANEYPTADGCVHCCPEAHTR